MNKTESRKRWLEVAEPISFTEDDFDVLDLTLSVIPDLRICAAVLKHARARHLNYPVESVDELIRNIDDGHFIAGRHVIDAEEIRTYMPDAFFPIDHEGELLSKVFAALGRQRYEMAALASLHPHSISRFLANQGKEEVKNV